MCIAHNIATKLFLILRICYPLRSKWIKRKTFKFLPRSKPNRDWSNMIIADGECANNKKLAEMLAFSMSLRMEKSYFSRGDKMIFENDIKDSNVHLKEVLKLIRENPELPVFPIVDENICDYIEFNVVFNLCKFEEPYIMKYCYYALDSDELEMYTDWSKDIIEYDAIKKNIKNIKWKEAIFVPISICEK